MKSEEAVEEIRACFAVAFATAGRSAREQEYGSADWTLARAEADAAIAAIEAGAMARLREQVLAIPTAGQNPSWVKAQALAVIDSFVEDD